MRISLSENRVIDIRFKREIVTRMSDGEWLSVKEVGHGGKTSIKTYCQISRVIDQNARGKANFDEIVNVSVLLNKVEVHPKVAQMLYGIAKDQKLNITFSAKGNDVDSKPISFKRALAKAFFVAKNKFSAQERNEIWCSFLCQYTLKNAPIIDMQKKVKFEKISK